MNLPPLPRPQFVIVGFDQDIFNAHEMTAYATAAVEAQEREIERLRHNERVYIDALWKACADDEDSVNAYLESQGPLRGEKQ